MKHDLVIEDPDVRQAVEDFLPIIDTVRRYSASAVTMPEDSPHRRALESEIQRLMSDIGTRADRLQLTTDALVALVNDDLDARARRGRPAPTRPTSRTLMRDLTEAQARVARAAAQVKGWQDEHAAAIAAQAAAEERAAAYGTRSGA